MSITYQETKEFSEKQLEELFLSVGWDSGRYPDKLRRAMLASSHVISAWDGERLVGLVRGLDDGQTIALVHYLLVHPDYQGLGVGRALMERLMPYFADILHVKVMPSDDKTIPFYERFGFRQGGGYSALSIEHFA